MASTGFQVNQRSLQTPLDIDIIGDAFHLKINDMPAHTTPEPTSTLSILALGTLGAASTLKRKLKPFKKETTKVS